MELNDVIKELEELKARVSELENRITKEELPDLGWAKWVAADENGEVYAYKEKPSRDEGEWRYIGSMSWQFSPHEHDIVIALCGRLPKWEDEEPTPVKR